MALSQRFNRALNLAFELHKDDLRKASGTPYLGHLLSVAAIVLDAGGSENAGIAALLHDAIEDHSAPGLIERIQAEFGEEVYQLIVGASDSFATPKPPWHERKRHHIERTSANLSQDLALVLAADKLHNLRSMITEYQTQGFDLWKAFKGSPADQIWYYSAMVELVVPLIPPSFARELRLVLSQFVLIARTTPVKLFTTEPN